MSDKITNGQLFMGLVYSLTQSVFISLGKLPDPMTGQFERQLEQASQTINLLAALEEKTKGNLEDDEEKFLSRTISDLRLNYVDEVNKPEADSESSSDDKESDSGDADDVKDETKEPTSPSSSDEAEAEKE